MQTLTQLALLVRDYDEAIAWFCDVLGFELLEDTTLSETKRWVRVAPSGGSGAGLLLAKAKNEEQLAVIGDQCGGRVFLFLETDDFDRDHATYLKRGVEFIEAPRQETFGKVAVFRDLYGNLWDLIGRA